MNDEGNSELVIQRSALKIPEIRFDGFSEEWEAREFGNDLLSVQTGTNLLAASGNSGCPLIKMGNMQRGYFSFEKVERLSANVEVEKENLANYGDFLFNTRNTLELVGKGATWMGESNEFAFNNNIARFTLKGVNTIFFNYLYNTQQMIKQVQARAMGTTSVAAIYPNNLKSIRYTLPKVEEQNRIGNYFHNLDVLINQHQQKHDKLSNIKKAMLEKMFPKQGETIPEIRFKGFSGEWQERQFSDIATRVSTHHQSTCLPCVEYEDIVAGKGRFNKDIHQKKTFKAGLKFEADDILFGKLRPYLKNWFLADFVGLAVGDFWVFRADNVASTFLFSLIQTNEFEFVSNLSAGSKMPRSDWALVSSCYFFVPKDIAESNEIGNYFQKLDALINQHEQQINKLNNIKQACLSKMFV